MSIGIWAAFAASAPLPTLRVVSRGIGRGIGRGWRGAGAAGRLSAAALTRRTA